MPDERDIRTRLLDGLAGEDRRQVEGVAALLTIMAPRLSVPPPELEERTLAAIRAAAGAHGTWTANGADSPVEAPNGAAPLTTPWADRLRLPRLALAGGLAAVALGAGVLAGTLLDGDRGLPGTTEVEATLTAPGGATAEATVQKTGIGRVVDFSTGDLPILPMGGYYELWFVGPADRPGRPDRISAGTFHPDENGRADIRFTAAVDPAEYRGLAVTAEPGDGNPAPDGEDVLRFAP